MFGNIPINCTYLQIFLEDWFFWNDNLINGVKTYAKYITGSLLRKSL